MHRSTSTLAAFSLLFLAMGARGSAEYVDCGPARRSLFHLFQYGSFYARPDGSLYYQHINDVHDE